MAVSQMRESSFRNNLALAREVAKRFAENKDIVRNFISNFETEDGDLHPLWGRRKYKAILQRAANEEIETIHIDLADLDSHINKVMTDSSSQFAKSMSLSKVQLQGSIETLLDDIESNAFRYLKYFHEACEAEMPKRDIDLQGKSKARDMVLQWRQGQAAELQEQGQGQAQIPSPLKINWEVRFKPRSNAKISHLREIGGPHVGSLVQLDCLVVRVGPVKPRVEVVTYHCEDCGAENFQIVEGDTFNPPSECASARCQQNKKTGKLRPHLRTSKFVKFQEMRVQEVSDQVPVGGVPRAITVHLSGDLARSVLPGDAITLTGVFTPYHLPWFQVRTRNAMIQEMYIDGHHIVKHKNGYNDSQEDEKALMDKVDAEWESGSIYERAAKSIAPEIYGHLDVKKALLLVLIGSFTKTLEDGLRIRGDIHTLLMGDPGVAKSQLLKQVVNLAPRSVYTTGKGSSGVGLTATVVRDAKTGEVTLEGGALVLADMGVCCIDEFDKMEEGDRTAIHEVMEQQTISIAKAGITTSLNCRTTIVAAANPQYGRYNPYKSPVENIDLPAALLSRFDLLFLLLDTVDVDKDRQLAMHVTKVHSVYDVKKEPAVEKEGFEAPIEPATQDILKLGFKPFDAHFMRTYIRKARTFVPVLDESLVKDVVEAYSTMREEEQKDGIDSRKSYTTPRTLLAILRLSQAHARARFAERVEREDFEEALRLMKASKESVELSAPAKKGQNPMDVICDIVSDLSRRSEREDSWVEVAMVISLASQKAFTSEMVARFLEEWVGLSVMEMSEDKELVRFVVPI